MISRALQRVQIDTRGKQIMPVSFLKNKNKERERERKSKKEAKRRKVGR